MLHCIALLLSVLWKKQRDSCSSLPYENAYLGGHWDCLYILGFAGSSCVFAECFERYQEYYPTSVLLKINMKSLVTKITILRNCVSSLLLKIKLQPAVTLACLFHSVNVCINILKHLSYSLATQPKRHAYYVFYLSSLLNVELRAFMTIKLHSCLPEV